MELNILLRLLMAHFLGDFVLQSGSWVNSKENKKYKSASLYVHVGVVTLLSYLLLAEWKNWWVPLTIFVTHLIIDIWKTYRPKTFFYFFLDQALHLMTIAGLWLIFYFNYTEVHTIFTKVFASKHLWILATAYLIVIWPLGIAIGKATESWRTAAAMDTDGLDKAGMWIGRCERILVLTFIITGQYTALGFLMASKSILRFAEKEPNAQKKTEYILVGTLISFSSAAIIGVIATYLLK